MGSDSKAYMSLIDKSCTFAEFWQALGTKFLKMKCKTKLTGPKLYTIFVTILNQEIFLCNNNKQTRLFIK